MRAPLCFLGTSLVAALAGCGDAKHPTSNETAAPITVGSGIETSPVEASGRSSAAVDPKAPDYVGARAFSSPAMPTKLAIDGKLDEWPFANGTNAFVSVDSSKLVIAIAWDTPPASEGISVALAARSTPYPTIGWVQRAGFTHDLTAETCEFQQIPLIEAGWDNGPRNPPEVAAACKRLLARHEKSAAAYREHFVRRYRITNAAIESLDTESPAWLADAKVVSGPKGVEVELPLAAMPELAEAPLAKLFVASAEGALPTLTAPGPIDFEGKPTGREGWTELSLEKPATFGKLHPLLALAFPVEDVEQSGGGYRLYAGSYHPSKPETLREIGVDEVSTKPTGPAPKRDGVIGPPTPPDRPSTNESESALFTTWRTFGEVEVGFSRGNLVTLLKGAFVASDYMGRPDGVRQFEKDVHLFAFSPGDHNLLAGWQYPRWSVLVLQPDGTLLADRLDEEGTPRWDNWDPGKSFNDKEWTTFGIEGLVEKKKTKVSWSWDPAARKYRAGSR